MAQLKKVFSRTAVVVVLITVLGTVIVAVIENLNKPSPDKDSGSKQYVGRILDNVTQLPVSSAKVTLDLPGMIPQIAYTDSEGIYSYNLTLQEGQQNGAVSVGVAGYQTYKRNISLSASVLTIDDIRLLPTSINDSTNTPEPTSTPAFVATSAPSPTSTVESQLVELIDKYYTCINVANPGSDSDYEECWNLLSDQPGEFQSNLNKNDYKSFWKKYKVTYTLFYCSKNLQNFVDAEYHLFDRNDLSSPIGNGEARYLEYSFALNGDGWRIKGADSSIREIGSYCEIEPRVEESEIRP